MSTLDKLRIDKWLWAARFYKTRSLAVDEILKTRVLVNGQACKPAREVKVGDKISIKQGNCEKEVIVNALSSVRGPAPVAQLLYEETPDSVMKREMEKERKRFASEPAESYTHGRPTKRDRRQLENWRNMF
ncbi:RNA-binding protein S4 [Pelistega indica]|uniref:RNA-binding protein S4 n=1 Tax=Pelistega indica TaxID=1414851 RepID=V8G2L0_9BURK|nr:MULTISPECIES: RNA-binding S4 domain-containing protein [Pelistega]ETD70759.1 RNA-binding protein S4 [Pelistega indica]